MLSSELLVLIDTDCFKVAEEVADVVGKVFGRDTVARAHANIQKELSSIKERRKRKLAIDVSWLYKVVSAGSIDILVYLCTGGGQPRNNSQTEDKEKHSKENTKEGQDQEKVLTLHDILQQYYSNNRMQCYIGDLNCVSSELQFLIFSIFILYSNVGKTLNYDEESIPCI